VKSGGVNLEKRAKQHGKRKRNLKKKGITRRKRETEEKGEREREAG
jgi:hypothetical protein